MSEQKPNPWTVDLDDPLFECPDCFAVVRVKSQEAKRRILAAAIRLLPPNLAVNCDQTAIVKALALPYADHPDYQESWRA